MAILKKNLQRQILLILLLSALSAVAQNPSYEDGLPHPAEVLDKIKAGSKTETLAKQAATFGLIMEAMVHSSYSLKQLQASKLTIQADYMKTINSLHEEFLKESNEENWSELQSKYMSDISLFEEIRDNLLRKEIKDSWARYVNTAITTKRSRENNSKNSEESARKQTQDMFSGLLFKGGATVIGIILFVIWLRRRSRRDQQADTQKINDAKKLAEYTSVIYNEFERLGATVEEREKNIKKVFERKDQTLHFQWHLNHTETYRGTQGGWHKDNTCYKEAEITRNIGAMEPREREFLRTVFLLFNEGKISGEDYRYYLFAFVNGNGKASIKRFDYYTHPDSSGVKDGPSTVKYLVDHWDASVDSAINKLLLQLEEIGVQNNAGKSIKEIKNRIHGGGVWLSNDEIEGTVFNGSGGYPLNLGHLNDSETILHYSGEGSLITIAPPGSGKTQCFVIPNMLNWKGAAVVLDIKGEIYSTTHKWREKNIGKVYKFSPLDPNNSNSYNPLVFLRDDPDYIWEDARFLADMMIVPSGASDPFWENMARDVLTAAIAHVAFNNEPSDRGMSKVLDIIYGIGWDEMIISLKTNVLVSSMRRMGNALVEMEKKQRDSVLKTAQSSLSGWQGERIGKVTNKSDWNPLDLRNGTPTIYICINPNEIESYLSLIRVFIAQHIRMLATELPQRGTAPVLFMLDELPRLKRMPPVDEALNIGRQYGIKLWMFAQSYGQLRDAYPDPEGLIGSCVVRTFMNLPLGDEFTTKISDQLGYRHDALGNTKEKLVEPIELAGPNYRDYILVLATGTKPAKVKKKFAYEDTELMAKIG